MLQIRDFKEEDRQAYLEMARDFYSSDASLFELEEQKLEDTFNIGVKGSPLMRGLTLCEQEKPVGYALLAFYWSCEAGGLVVQGGGAVFHPAVPRQRLWSSVFSVAVCRVPAGETFSSGGLPIQSKGKKAV